MITDEQIQTILTAKEKAIDQDGWDQKPNLNVAMLDTTDPAAPQLHFVELPVTNWGDTGDTLLRLALMLIEDSDLAATLAAPAGEHHSFYGILFVHEAWMLTDPNDIKERFRAGNYRRIMDFPSADEVRLLNYCDIKGRMQQLTHFRKGETTNYNLSDKATGLTGRVVKAQIVIVKAIATQLPERATIMKDLNKLIRKLKHAKDMSDAFNAPTPGSE